MKICDAGAKLKDSFEIWKCSYQRKSKRIIHLVCAQIFRKITFFTPLIRKHMYTYQGVKNVSFLVNFAYVLNELKFDVTLHLYFIQKVWNGMLLK